jgi:hypothetical protein
VQATIAYARKHPEIAVAFNDYLKQLERRC